MTHLCPNPNCGHQSRDPVECDRCRQPMKESVSLAPNPTGPSAPEIRCRACDAARVGDANFCHQCGRPYPPGPEPSAPDEEPAVFEIVVRADRAFYDRAVRTGQERPPFPDYAPERTLPAREDTIEIGRRLRPAPGQPMPLVNLALAPAADLGVSGLHAVLRRKGAEWTVTDLESRNGLRVDDVELEPQSPYSLGPDSIIHIGYWTAIRLRRTDTGERP